MLVPSLVQTDPASGSIALAFNGFNANTQDPVSNCGIEEAWLKSLSKWSVPVGDKQGGAEWEPEHRRVEVI